MVRAPARDVSGRDLLSTLAAMLRSVSWLVFAASLALSMPAAAAAQASDAASGGAAVDPGDEEARLRFEAGRVAFIAGRNEEALADFRRAYELSERPALLYNIGVALDRLRRDAEALEAFERYLAEAPPAQLQNRGEVEARIGVLREAIARDAAAEQTPPPIPASDDGPDGVGLALAIVGGAIALGGVGVLVAGSLDRARVDGAMSPAEWSDYADSAARAPILEGVGAAVAGVGAALAVVGIVILASPRSPTGEQARLRVSPFGISLDVEL